MRVNASLTMAARMEVDGDPPPDLPGLSSNLKRCSSAPMINMLDDSSSATLTGDRKRAVDDSARPSGAHRSVS